MQKEVRKGRSLFFEESPRDPNGRFADADIIAVLVHGACGHSRQWRDVQSILRTSGLDTVIYDALGCGQSARLLDFTAYSPHELYEDFVAVVESTRQAHKAEARFLLVCHSFGCALALQLASQVSNQIAGLVLIGPYIPPEEKPARFSKAAWLFYLPDWVLSWMQPSLTEDFLRAAFHPVTWQEQPQLIDQERQASNSNPPFMFKAFYRQMPKLGGSETVAAWARAVSKPVLIIFGDSDQMTSISRAHEILMSNLPRGSMTEISQAGHQVLQEKPEEICAAMQELLFKL